jgi:hypothetical protein
MMAPLPGPDGAGKECVKRCLRVAAAVGGWLRRRVGLSAAKTGATGKLPWGAWADHPKVVFGGREYAQIGKRLYTRHAVERTMPRGLTMEGRSISPNFVEDVIQTGTRSNVAVDGVLRQTYRSGSVEGVTEEGGRIVVTVNPFKLAR